jgi:hypothetical protein
VATNVKHQQTCAEHGSEEGLEDCSCSPLVGNIICSGKGPGAAIVKVLCKVEFYLKYTQKYESNVRDERFVSFHYHVLTIHYKHLNVEVYKNNKVKHILRHKNTQFIACYIHIDQGM